MLRRAFFAALGCLVVCQAGVQAAEADELVGARYPALSPDGDTVVFEYWGDLWAAPIDGGSSARRLTDHLAWDWLPRFSPDGSEIAFVSDRSGNQDVWVMPATGGEARQVTKHSGSDTLCDWLGDGSRIVFSSNRGLWSADLYYVDSCAVDPPTQVTRLDHYNSTEGLGLSDGGWVLTRGAGHWWRKGYRGTAQTDLWRIHPDGRYEQLTDHPGYDRWPMLSADRSTVYYVSDQDGTDNIWGLQLSSGKQRQVTHHTRDGVQWPSIQQGGSTVVYEFEGRLYAVDVDGGAPRRLTLAISGEGKGNLVVKEEFNNDSEDYAVSPHGKYVVLLHAGDLWAVKDPEAYEDDEKPDQDLSRAWRLTASDGARERYPAFAADNRHIAYASDADGDYEIYVMDLADMSVRQVTDNPVDDLVPQFDPANKDFLFCYSGNRELVRHNLSSGESNLVAEGRFRGDFGYCGYRVSPDGAWVAYVDELDDWSAEVYIVDAAGESSPVNITRHPEWDDAPRWSADGRRLIYRGQREDDSAIFVVDLDPEPEEYDLVFLFEEDRPAADAEDAGEDGGGNSGSAESAGSENGETEDDEDDEEGDEENNDDDEKDDGEEENDTCTVTIDFEDIHLRARQVTKQSGARTAVVSDDAEWVLFSCDPDDQGRELWAVKADGGDARKLLDGNWAAPQFADKGKRVYYLDGGTIRYLKFRNGENRGRETIDARGEFWLDQRERWRQMFREGWRTLREQFYDAEMHGVDWSAMYEKYEPLMERIGTPEEFGLLFEELLGELNASHLGIYMADTSFDGPGPVTGHLGLEFDPDYPGPGLRVSHVTYKGPADQAGVELAEGDVLLRIGSEPVDAGMRWLDLLDDRAGEPTTLQVADSDGASTRDVTLKPISYGAYQGLLYREWEIANERTVDELSEGRIGYIHIRGMSRSELRKFEREFISECFDRDALIVDVRFNPGGWIHEDLFSLLDRDPFAYAGHRDASPVLQPARAFLKPKVLLINARSGSDAEIFPAGWRVLGLGPIVGTETAGAVIGTNGFNLIDGTWVRLPVEGWWELGGRNLERSGTPPDVAVDVDPVELREGRDAQLERAVEVLLAELE